MKTAGIIPLEYKILPCKLGFMVLTPELQTVVNALQNEKIIGLLAPSFPVDFVYPQIILDLKKMGIAKIVELTYAAKLINMEYEKILKENPSKRYICPNCPTVVKIIEFKYPEFKENIINVASPMVVMDRFIKKTIRTRMENDLHRTMFSEKDGSQRILN